MILKNWDCEKKARLHSLPHPLLEPFLIVLKLPKWDDILLHQQFDHIGNGLQKAKRSNPIWPDPVLDKGTDPSLNVHQEHHGGQNRDQDDGDLQYGNDDLFGHGESLLRRLD